MLLRGGERCAYRFLYLLAHVHPAQRGRLVLYLDLDGVVHHERVLWHPHKGIHMSPYEAPGRSLFEWVPILEAALDPYPSVALVLQQHLVHPARLQRNPQTTPSFLALSLHWWDIPQAGAWRRPLESGDVPGHATGRAGT